MLNFQDENELKQYLKTNLLPMEDARKITDQSTSAFTQSVANELIIPFYQTETASGRIQNKLFLRSELETYRDNKKR